MADTETAIATLLATNFADGQAEGSIVPNDIRDLIVSLQTTFGGYYVSATAATSISAVDTWTKCAGTTTANSNLKNFSMPTDNRIRNDGTATRLVHVTASISFTTANNSKIIGFGVAKNGTTDANSEIRRKTGTGSDIGALALAWPVELAATDYVEIFCVNRTDADNPTIQFMSVQVQGFIE